VADRSEDRRRLKAKMEALREADWQEVAETYALSYRELRRRVAELSRSPDGLRDAVAGLDPVALQMLRMAARFAQDTLGSIGRATRLISGGEEQDPTPDELEATRRLADALEAEALTRSLEAG